MRFYILKNNIETKSHKKMLKNEFCFRVQTLSKLSSKKEIWILEVVSKFETSLNFFINSIYKEMGFVSDKKILNKLVNSVLYFSFSSFEN
jgi:hypothetical protein